MATYDYKCDACEYQFTRQYRMSEYDTPFSEPCPKCNVTGYVRRFIGPAMFTDHTRVEHQTKRLSEDFKENMRLIKKGNPGSTMPDY